MAELADAPGLGPGPFGDGGSNPLARTLSPAHSGWLASPRPLAGNASRRPPRPQRKPAGSRPSAAPGVELPGLASWPRAVLAVDHAPRRRVRTERGRLGPRTGRGVRGLRRHQGHHPPGHAGDHPDQPRREIRQDPQDPVDEGRARRRLRRRRLQGRCTHPPCLVLQPGRRSPRRAPGRSGEDRHGGPGGHRGREGDLVGAGGGRLPGLRRLPEEDRPRDPRLRARAAATADPTVSGCRERSASASG